MIIVIAIITTFDPRQYDAVAAFSDCATVGTSVTILIISIVAGFLILPNYAVPALG